MRDVAREMNLSETAFLVPQDGGYNLRWFTPAVEVDLCGHATLASAHVLWEDGHLAATRRRASTRAAGCCWPSAPAIGSRWIFRPRPRKPPSRPRISPRLSD
jgi:predicted PhzF superfamily epimerase YddE/YHI9